MNKRNEKDEAPNIFISLPDTATASLADPSMVMFWKNLENRTLWITGEIDSGTLDLIDYIMYFNREDKGVPIEQRRPIKILINSVGGSLDVADSLISTFKLSKTPIYTYAIGIVASAASLIYLSAHRRFALPNAYWLLHQGSCENLSGTYAQIIAAIEDYTKTVEKMTQFYIDNTTFSEEEIRENIQDDWYLYIDEALERNIATDRIEDIDDLL